jgi:two-component system heavy metal sensor histidine kinase CusS
MSSKSAPDPAREPIAPRRVWSLAGRLTAWYAGSAFLLVLLATAYLYWALVRNMDREDDELLADKVRAIQVLLRAEPIDTAAIRHEVEGRSEARQTEKTYVRIRDEEGQTLIESPGMPQLPDSALPIPTPSPARGKDAFENGRAFRMLAVQPAGSPWTILLAMDRTLETELLAEYREQVGYVLGVSLLVCAAIGYLIAHRGLRPIAQITQTAQRIRPSNLRERLHADGLPAELRALAATFNAMLDRLEQSFARLSRFSADIAHELRTPVFGLRGEVEVALSKPRTEAEYREVLISGLEECGRLAHIIDRLLFLARAEDPQTQLAREPCEIGAELAAVRDFYEPAASEAGVRLEVSVPAPIHVPLDRALFQRAVGNLAANAIAHTPPGGQVTLTAAQGDGAVTVEVIDTGAGIPAEYLPHLFDRFYRVDQSRTSRNGNVGLGLAIARSIVELHGGSARIDSQLGRGTRVTLTFPVPG